MRKEVRKEGEMGAFRQKYARNLRLFVKRHGRNKAKTLYICAI
jgi:hypothetical protein